MSLAIAVGTGLCGLLAGGTLGVIAGAALGGRRRHELEKTLAWYERVVEDSAALTGTGEESTVAKSPS
jgi:hypothetical protein